MNHFQGLRHAEGGVQLQQEIGKVWNEIEVAPPECSSQIAKGQ